MKVSQLKKLLEGVDDDAEVIIPANADEFTGLFYSPCPEDSGPCEICSDPTLSPEDIKEMELLNKPLPQAPAFILVPCGFGEEKDHSHELN